MALNSKPSLPVIDVSSFLSPAPDPTALDACATAIDAACTTHGFFYLTGHGIPESTTSAVLELARKFFLQGSPEDKERIKRLEVGEKDGDGARGYQVLGENITGGKRDWHEAIDIYPPWFETLASPPQGASTNGAQSGEQAGTRGPPYALLQGENKWPAHPAELRGVYERYMEDMKRVGTAVVRAMGKALQLGEEDGGEELFVNNSRRAYWIMRMIGYPGLPERRDSAAEGMDDESFSCGEHTDYGCVTLLLADNTKGALQVLSKDGTWLAADPLPGAFVVNIGDMMERWTNGLWKSTFHRVINRSSAYRVSVPFFFEPDFFARIRPLNKCVEKTGGEVKYSEAVYGEHLVKKIRGNF